MSENISSNVLFHFTKSMGNLKSILKNGFYPRYCAEYTLDPADRRAAYRRKHPMRAAPMVCFCDLPLSLILRHLKTYGPFGIGLTKQWGLRSRVTPVIYTHREAPTLRPILRLAAKADKETDSTAASNSRLLATYTKPLVGPAWRNGRLTKKPVRFYDEREWRYVPVVREVKSLLLAWPDYASSDKKDALHKLFGRKYRLSVHPDDIMYLILPYTPDERHVLDLARFLKGLYKADDAVLVATTIITDDCLKEDV
ncbi:MAG: abortive infection system antitoxin AbiGi family protein [Verrucomicrobiota bacterium]